MSEAARATTVEVDVEGNLSEDHGMWGGVARQMLRRPAVLIALVIAVFFIFVAAFPGVFTSVDPQHCNIAESKIKPRGLGHAHPFGTDLHGCDVLSQLVHGARPSLLLAFTVVGASLIIGVLLGTLAGFYLGWVDAAVSRVLEIFLVIPLLLAALLLLSLFRNVDVGDGQLATIIQPMIVLTSFGWMGYTRYVRAAVLEAKNLDYVRAARGLGATDVRLMFSHILPNAIAPVTALVPTAIAGVISTEAVLAFLGIGVRPPAISWGIMISSGAAWFTGGFPHLLLFPLGCLLATVLAFVVIGDNLRDALDPKLK
ncbi:ABC transporter permease [Microlunatus soli]|uniref:Oligopeptide transport system permease protein n=1 Tax=Microlunatus soli TaxID=630515 RepID=A0A1H1WGF7_9ACTN|nr:ABC transporter permease [Microlunatus soli]SDS96155.1 oligopeptide transport system permease protein [Microlunatus soli]